MIIIGVVLTTIAAVLLNLLSDEARAWVPRLVDRLLRFHISRVPHDLGDRLLEEWRADVAGLPGELSRLWFALDLFRGTPRITWEHLASGLSFSPITTVGKRTFDVCLAAISLALFLPSLTALVLVLRLQSPEPILARSRRIGRAGRPFDLLTFRVPEAGAFGHFLHQTSLSELPQLINVLRGGMSFVGPRPSRHEKAAELLNGPFRGVLAVRPGMTGVAQVFSRSDPPSGHASICNTSRTSRCGRTRCCSHSPSFG